jgi:hypothetical protein
MWKSLFGVAREEAVPIGHITNGVHVSTWLAPQMRLLYDRHLGAGWIMRGGDRLWEAIAAIDDGELWAAHQTLKTRLGGSLRRPERVRHRRRRHARVDGCSRRPRWTGTDGCPEGASRAALLRARSRRTAAGGDRRIKRAIGGSARKYRNRPAALAHGEPATPEPNALARVSRIDKRCATE